jgi:3-oxoacyl-[acyl-carrier-protein] synthase-3
MTDTSIEIGIEGIGVFLGQIINTNVDLSTENPDWDFDRITERAGVCSRPTAGDGFTALDLGHQAAINLLETLQINLSDIDALIFCTQTPDFLLPSNSSLLHGRLGLPMNVMAFDITHACSGFVYSLGIAKSLIISKLASRVLVINADTYTKLVHPRDRSTRPLFGDGASATIISNKNIRMKIYNSSFGTAGKYADRFIVKNGGIRNGINKPHSRQPIETANGKIISENYIQMDGLGLLSFFNSTLPKFILDFLSNEDLDISKIKYFVFHQASRLALDGLSKSLKIPAAKMVIDMTDTGNLVSASIPIVLARMIKENKFQNGDLVLLCGFGVGLSWGVTLLKT